MEASGAFVPGLADSIQALGASGRAFGPVSSASIPAFARSSGGGDFSIGASSVMASG